MNWHINPDTALIGFLLVAAAGAITFLASLRQQDSAISEHDEDQVTALWRRSV